MGYAFVVGDLLMAGLVERVNLRLGRHFLSVGQVIAGS